MRKFAFIALLNVAILAGTLVFLEGLASTILFARDLAHTRPVAERRHTRHDELLGWVNTPNVTIEDMYGPGASLRINAQGFRNTRDFPREVAQGKIRAICAGDSFAFGYGVDNELTWCERLIAHEPRLETVNMGQGGYGIDQAYLWYKRDGLKLEHDLLLFAFITLDFDRMQKSRFVGYGKPLFTVEDDKLVLTNVPVPKGGSLVPWLNQRLNAVRGLRSFELLRTFVGKRRSADAGAQAKTSGGRGQPSPEIVAEKIFVDLARLARESGSVPVLIYLPFRVAAEDDMRWQRAVRDIAERHQIALVDLVNLFDGLPSSEVATMFIPEGALSYHGAAGHYTVKGNEYVAQALLAQLKLLPTAKLLSD